MSQTDGPSQPAGGGSRDHQPPTAEPMAPAGPPAQEASASPVAPPLADPAGPDSPPPALEAASPARGAPPAPVVETPAAPPPPLTAEPHHDGAPFPPSGPGRRNAEPPPGAATIIVRYGLMRQLGQFVHDLSEPPTPGTRVVVRTERGVELGDVVVSVSETPSWRCVTSARLSEHLASAGPDYPFFRGGKLLRLANAQDVIDFRHLESSARDAAAFCREQIRQMNLPMRLVKVEHLLGGERIIFYFSSETRVDFRELVRRLASQFRTRIEMRQVGARDEARLIADYERCGQRCCCQEYLKDLKPVSMRMAKMQKATLDPSKISGRCGRLMCCLRYEDAVYEDLRKKLPRKSIWVRTASLVGKVVEGQVLTQLVRLMLPDGTWAVVANEEILERDVPPPEIRPPRAPEPPRPERAEPRLLRDEAAGVGQAPENSQADEGRLPPGEAEELIGQGPPGQSRDRADRTPPPRPGAFGGTPPGPRNGQRPRRRDDRRRESTRPPGQGQTQPPAPVPQEQPESPGAAQPAGAGSGPSGAPPAQTAGQPPGQGGRKSRGKRRRRRRDRRDRPDNQSGGRPPGGPPPAPPSPPA